MTAKGRGHQTKRSKPELSSNTTADVVPSLRCVSTNICVCANTTGKMKIIKEPVSVASAADGREKKKNQRQTRESTHQQDIVRFSHDALLMQQQLTGWGLPMFLFCRLLFVFYFFGVFFRCGFAGAFAGTGGVSSRESFRSAGYCDITDPAQRRTVWPFDLHLGLI